MWGLRPGVTLEKVVRRKALLSCSISSLACDCLASLFLRASGVSRRQQQRMWELKHGVSLVLLTFAPCQMRDAVCFLLLAPQQPIPFRMDSDVGLMLPGADPSLGERLSPLAATAGSPPWQPLQAPKATRGPSLISPSAPCTFCLGSNPRLLAACQLLPKCCWTVTRREVACFASLFS